MSRNWLFGMLLFLWIHPASAQDASYYLQRGIETYRASRYEEALRLFDRALQTDANSAEAYLYRGNCQFILRRYLEAETDYTSALENSYRARPESTGGSYRTEGVTILEPNPQARDREVYALLYNNRGAARYLQGRREDALRDFDLALDFSPSLELARENRALVTTGSSTRLNNSYPADFGPSRGAALGRPIDPIQWDDVDELQDQAMAIRDYREDGRLSGFAGLIQPRPFVKRTVPRKGKVYKLPNVAATSQTYIQILEVTITDRETLVRVAVENKEGKAYYTRIFPPGRPESYVLVDRQPDGTNGGRYELLKVDGIATDGTGTMIRPDEIIEFTLTFRKIDDRIGYLHLVEGDLQIDSAWNFYHIDLTR